MRHIDDKSEFDEIRLKAKTCAFIDSRRIPTPLRLMVFDDAMLCTDYFFAALKTLMQWSTDQSVFFLVMEPDPVDFFHREYKKYPLLQLDRSDSAEVYLSALNESLDEEGWSLGSLASTWLVIPPSNRWFIHAMRASEDNSGHLWVRSDWVGKLVATFGGIFRETLGGSQIYTDPLTARDRGRVSSRFFD